VLRTSRLVLRELNLEDCDALHEIESNPVVTRYLPFDARTAAEARAYLETAVCDQRANPRHTYDLAITLRNAQPELRLPVPDHTLIGRCGLSIRRPQHQEAVVWYVLHPAAWGRGFAVEAATAVLEFGFNGLGLHRIWADCDPRNTASCQVAERLNMRLEGHLRENYFLKGEWCSTAVYAMLEGEWRASKEG